MKKLIPIFILFLFFNSCNKVNVSSDEKLALDKIAQFYGGLINYNKGFENHNGISKDYFEIKINKSPLLNNDQVNLTKHAGNMAYLFYSNLSKENKKKFNEVRVSIDLNNGEGRSYKFKISELEGVLSFLPSLENVNYLIISKDYKKLAESFSNDSNVKEESIKELFNKVNETFGETKEIQYQGHEFSTDDKLGDCVTYKEVIVLEKQAIQMFVTYQMKTRELIMLYIP